MISDKRRWEERFRTKAVALGREPNYFLKKCIRFLPKGRALDLASGEGRNAVFLAQHGFEVDAVDISEAGLWKTQALAEKRGVKVRTILADLDAYSIKRGWYDLIVDLYFLDRKIIPKIREGLKKGGMVLFETYLLEHRNLHADGPKNPKYLLKPNEALHLFESFRILFYREGIFEEGGRRKAVASLIAQRT